MDYVLPSTNVTASATQTIRISMLNSSDHMRPYPRFAYVLADIHAGLGEVYDWLHLYTTGLSPATFYQLAWRSALHVSGPVQRSLRVPTHMVAKLLYVAR